MTLEIDRVTNLIDLVDKLLCESVDTSGDSDARVLVTPVTLLRLEMEYLDAAIHRLQPNWHEPEAAEPRDLHEATVAEIREEYPTADDAEVKLRVAIRESMCMTREEENTAYERISKAAQS